MKDLNDTLNESYIYVDIAKLEDVANKKYHGKVEDLMTKGYGLTLKSNWRSLYKEGRIYIDSKDHSDRKARPKARINKFMLDFDGYFAGKSIANKQQPDSDGTKCPPRVADDAIKARSVTAGTNSVYNTGIKRVRKNNSKYSSANLSSQTVANVASPVNAKKTVGTTVAKPKLAKATKSSPVSNNTTATNNANTVPVKLKAPSVSLGKWIVDGDLLKHEIRDSTYQFFVIKKDIVNNECALYLETNGKQLVPLIRGKASISFHNLVDVKNSDIILKVYDELSRDSASYIRALKDFMLGGGRYDGISYDASSISYRPFEKSSDRLVLSIDFPKTIEEGKGVVLSYFRVDKNNKVYTKGYLENLPYNYLFNADDLYESIVELEEDYIKRTYPVLFDMGYIKTSIGNLALEMVDETSKDAIVDLLDDNEMSIATNDGGIHGLLPISKYTGKTGYKAIVWALLNSVIGNLVSGYKSYQAFDMLSYTYTVDDCEMTVDMEKVLDEDYFYNTGKLAFHVNGLSYTYTGNANLQPVNVEMSTVDKEDKYIEITEYPAFFSKLVQAYLKRCYKKYTIPEEDDGTVSMISNDYYQLLSSVSSFDHKKAYLLISDDLMRESKLKKENLMLYATVDTDREAKEIRKIYLTFSPIRGKDLTEDDLWDILDKVKVSNKGKAFAYYLYSDTNVKVNNKGVTEITVEVHKDRINSFCVDTGLYNI